jgi:tetratricopeptide (TPR) repeat protein
MGKSSKFGRGLTNIISALLVVGLGLVAQAHNADHEVLPVVGQDVLSATTATPPDKLGFSSIQLLMSDITLEGGYGRGWYYVTPQNSTEEMINQGFAMYNMFQYTDAFRSFNTALKADPTLTIAQIGRALNAMNLDQNDQFYLVEAYDHIMANASKMDSKTLAWSNMFLAMVTGKDSSGKNLDAQSAYAALKSADPDNLEVISAINWVANIYNMNDFNMALQKDPENVGALHYLMHIAEGQNDHAEALRYAERMVVLTPRSAHGQHMYGHVLPHFNRWAEADKQFAIAHQLHLDWGKANNVSPNEDWHYGHNLQLFSVTKMVVDPANAVSVLQMIEAVNPGAIIDTLDYLTATTDLGQKAGLEKYLTDVESYSVQYKNYVQSSRLFFELVFSASDANTVSKIATSLSSMPNFKNKNFLQFATAYIQAVRSNNVASQTQILNRLIGQLNANFSRGGFDGWQQSVIETLMYKKVFEVYGSTEGVNRIQKEIADVYMNPID